MLPSRLKGTTKNIVHGRSWAEPQNLHMALLFHLPLVPRLLLYSPQNLHSEDHHVALLFHLSANGQFGNLALLCDLDKIL